MSNALLEAMHAGQAVLATKVGGNPEVVVDGVTGRLVPANDVQALAEGLRWMVVSTEARRRMGNAGRLRVEREFAIERTIQRLDAIYQECLFPAESRKVQQRFSGCVHWPRDLP
jgi:glycosyltransferase involved in cell wall biosynthesis